MKTLKNITIHLGVLYIVTAISHVISPVIFEVFAQHGVLSNDNDLL